MDNVKDFAVGGNYRIVSSQITHLPEVFVQHPKHPAQFVICYVKKIDTYDSAVNFRMNIKRPVI